MRLNLRSRNVPLVFGSVLLGLVFFGFVVGATLGNESIYKYLNVFAEVYNLVRGNYVDSVDEAALLEGAYRGMAGGLDPFSAYLSKDDFAAIQRDATGGAAETGLEVLRNPSGAVVVAVRAGSQAEKGGLRTGDQIWAIDGAPTRQMSLLQVRRAQRGADGSMVRLLVYHQSTQKREDLRIRRTFVSGPAFVSRLIEGKIGYLKLISLERVERDSLKAAMLSLRQRGASRLLLDLRGCAGGGVEDGVRVASLFLPPGPVVYVQDRSGARVVKASTSSAVWTLPISVLENGGSAGGAEIVAAALRARLKSPLLGETTYGLGSTQELVPLPSGDGLVISANKLVSPTGESWNRSGLKPDKEIPAPEEQADLEVDSQLQKAIELLRAPSSKAA